MTQSKIAERCGYAQYLSRTEESKVQLFAILNFLGVLDIARQNARLL
jgi:hypothetical protein